MTLNRVERQIREALSEITKGRDPLNASADASLDTVGVDSIAMIDLIYKLEELFGIKIPDDDVTPENFESIASLVTLVNQKCSS
jgi:acyl carrier protein